VGSIVGKSQLTPAAIQEQIGRRLRGLEGVAVVKAGVADSLAALFSLAVQLFDRTGVICANSGLQPRT